MSNINNYGTTIIKNPENLTWVEAKEIILNALEEGKAVAIESIYQPQIDPRCLSESEIRQAMTMYGIQALQPLPLVTLFKKVGEDMYDSPQIIFQPSGMFMEDLNRTYLRDKSILEHYIKNVIDINSEIAPYDSVDCSLEEFCQRAASGEIAVFNIVIIEKYEELIVDLILYSNTSKISVTNSKVKHTYNLVFPGGGPAEFYRAERDQRHNWDITYTTTKHRETWSAEQMIKYYLDYANRGIMVFMQ